LIRKETCSSRFSSGFNGTEESDSSNLNELPKSTARVWRRDDRLCRDANFALYAHRKQSRNYNDELDGLAIAPNGTVFFATQWDGVCVPSSGAPLTKSR